MKIKQYEQVIGAIRYTFLSQLQESDLDQVTVMRCLTNLVHEMWNLEYPERYHYGDI